MRADTSGSTQIFNRVVQPGPLISNKGLEEEPLERELKDSTVDPIQLTASFEYDCYDIKMKILIGKKVTLHVSYL